MSNLSNTFEYIVGPEEAGERVDLFLASFLEGFSRTFIQKMIRQGCLRINGKTPKPSHILNEGEGVFLEIPPAVAAEPLPEEIPLNIVYEDDDLIVLNKQAGLVVHPAPGHSSGTLVNGLIRHCGDLSSIGGVLRPGIVHRLDKDTTGLMVVAKNDIAHRRLSAQLVTRDLKRYYITLVAGEMARDTGVINAPVGRCPRHRKLMAVNWENGKQAATHYRVLLRAHGMSLVEAQLETGRTHQIRVHMRHINHPVVGDPDYGPDRRRITLGIERGNSLLVSMIRGLKVQMLHATSLVLIHPKSGMEMIFEAPLPEPFLTIAALMAPSKDRNTI
ncbi:MAG TPA: RluA family pseudouridine synthase [Candidatus Sumerlaeota bacterium]|nr:RluA family pseudouridine synthase [Candidatus Sumerlaeota bacterium]